MTATPPPDGRPQQVDGTPDAEGKPGLEGQPPEDTAPPVDGPSGEESGAGGGGRGKGAGGRANDSMTGGIEGSAGDDSPAAADSADRGALAGAADAGGAILEGAVVAAASAPRAEAASAPAVLPAGMGVTEVLVARNLLLVHLEADTPAEALHVAIGPQALPLRPAGPEELAQVPLEVPLEVSEAARGGIAAEPSPGRPALRERCLPGLPALWITLPPGTPARHIPLGPPIALPPGVEALELRAELACIGARASLTVRLLPPERGRGTAAEPGAEAPSNNPAEDLAEGPGGVPMSVRFDRHCTGGRQPDRFQPLRLALPPAMPGDAGADAGPRRLLLGIDYRGSDPEAPGVRGLDGAAVGVMWPRLAVAGAADLPLVPLRLRAGTEEAGGDPPHPSHPHKGEGGRPAPGRWHAVTVPPAALTPCSRMVLVREGPTGGRRAELMAAADPRISLVTEGGHTLHLTADAPLQAVLHCDGRPLLPVTLGPEPATLRLPPEALTGAPMLAELRDATGSQPLIARWLLPPRLIPAPDRPPAPPQPTQIAPRSAARLQGLRAHVAAGTPPAELARLSQALELLEGEALGIDPGRVPPGVLGFPELEAPEVSVVIPAHGQIRATLACLAALMLAHCRASFEVILVDDASRDETGRIEEMVSGLRVIRNPAPLRFLRAASAGVAAARAPHVVLLNNDTEPTPGWLDALRDGFDRFAGAGPGAGPVGMTGAKLLTMDGRLQECGGIVWRSGNPWNYGARENPWEPRFGYARQTDYVSGAALMVIRAAWDAVGGFSDDYAPMYFEDTDLAFKLRAAGYSTWVIPAALVFHAEGTTSGTDTGSGFKRYQEVNRPKFRRRWAAAVAGHRPEGVAPDLEKDRGILGRALVILPATPGSGADPEAQVALTRIAALRALGLKVTLLPQDMAHAGADSAALEADGTEVITAPFWPSAEAFLDDRGGEFDVALLTGTALARTLLPRLREVNPGLPVIFDGAELEFLHRMRSAAGASDAEALAEAQAFRAEELAVIRAADLTLAADDAAQAVIEAHSFGAARVLRCPEALAAPAEVPPHAGRRGLCLIGDFARAQDLEALVWFAGRVLPLLPQEAAQAAGAAPAKRRRAGDKATPGGRTGNQASGAAAGAAAEALLLAVHGRDIDASMAGLAGPGLALHGRTADLATAFAPHLALVVPAPLGPGAQTRVLAALAHGLPCILDPALAQRMSLRDGQDCLTAGSPGEWAAAFGRLTTDPALWQRLSDSGRALIATHHSPARARANLRAAMEAVGLYHLRS